MLNKKRYITFISAVTTLAILMTSCSLNTEKFGSAFEHLNENLNEAISETTEATIEESVANETEVEETTEEVGTEELEEIEATPTPTATPTPEPTEVPVYVPERVDFSELTEDQLSDTITVELEAFSENYVTEDEIVAAIFEGNRMLISSEDATNVQVAVNLILDSFYEEALGAYNSNRVEVLSELEINPVEEGMEFEPVTGTVTYDYGFNGRVLSVVMTYDIVRGEEVLATNMETSTFDLYTGSYVVLENIISDMEGFETAARAQLAFSSEDEKAKPEEFSEISIMARNDDSSILICGVRNNGERVSALVDVNDYSVYMNRYGRIIF